jgi:hypothetical protein
LHEALDFPDECSDDPEERLQLGRGGTRNGRPAVDRLGSMAVIRNFGVTVTCG